MANASFQTSVPFNQALGVVGELYDTSPVRSQPYTLVSASAAYNVFGRAFSITGEGTCAAGNSGTAQFAGILCNPKVGALLGDGTLPLNPSLTLPNGAIGELITMGCMIVTLGASAAIGDLVVYDNTTGVLETIAPDANLPVGKSFAYAQVDRFTVSAAGLAVIMITKIPPIPVLA
jgi:hypothetical protein